MACSLYKNIGANELLRAVGFQRCEFIRKRSSISKTFSSRWPLRLVISSEGCLYVYENEYSKQPNYVFAMSEFESVCIHNTHNTEDVCYRFCIKFCEPNKEPLFFACVTHQSRGLWLNEIQNSLHKAKTDQDNPARQSKRSSWASVDSGVSGLTSSMDPISLLSPLGESGEVADESRDGDSLAGGLKLRMEHKNNLIVNFHGKNFKASRVSTINDTFPRIKPNKSPKPYYTIGKARGSNPASPDVRNNIYDFGDEDNANETADTTALYTNDTDPVQETTDPATDTANTYITMSPVAMNFSVNEDKQQREPHQHEESVHFDEETFRKEVFDDDVYETYLSPTSITKPKTTEDVPNIGGDVPNIGEDEIEVEPLYVNVTGPFKLESYMYSAVDSDDTIQQQLNDKEEGTFLVYCRRDQPDKLVVKTADSIETWEIQEQCDMLCLVENRMLPTLDLLLQFYRDNPLPSAHCRLQLYQGYNDV